jgi:hypothetical protein
MASEPVTPQHPDPTRVANRSIPLAKANVYGILLAPLLLGIIMIPFSLRWGWDALFAWRSQLTVSDTAYLLILTAILVVSIIVHEALHAVGWAIAGRIGWSHMEFGVHWFTPYAHTSIAMPAWAYRIGAALPGVVLGVIPGVVAIGAGSGWLALYGAIMLMCAVGDIMVLWLLRGVPGDVRVLDHPSEAGCQIIMTDD